VATRMQQRRGTAAQWVSTNNGDGPILEVGEIGFEADTGKFKIGDGTNNWIDLPYFADVETLGSALDGDYLELTDVGAASGVAGLDANKNLLVPGASIIVEGLTDNTFETILTITDPTQDRTITFPDASGTVALTTDIAAGTVTETGTQTLINKTLTSPTINGATIGGSLIPSANATYDLGSSTNKFKDLYLSGATLYLDAATISLHSGNVQLSHSGNTTTIPIGGGAHTVATQSYVDTAVSNLVDAAPSTLNTLNELAAAINDDASYASTITTALGNKLDSSTASSTYAPIASPTFTGTVGGITKSMVGLGNVDNTTDLLKPISTATQTALDLKAPLASPTFTGTVSGITATMVGLGNVDNTSDANKPVSTATQTALNLKADLASPTFTGTVTLPAGTSGANLVNIPNAALDNSSITINGSSVSLGGSTTIDALPSQTSNSGKYLTTDGTTASWVTVPTGATAQSVSSNISLQHNYNYFVNTSAARTLTLSATPSLGDTIAIIDATGSAATNNIVVSSNGGKINGTVQDLEIDVNNAAAVLVYTGSTYGWRVG